MEDSEISSRISESVHVPRKAPISISAVGKAMSQELQKPIVRRVAEAAILLKSAGSDGDASLRDRHEETSETTTGKVRGLYFGRNVATSMWWKYRRPSEEPDSTTPDYGSLHWNKFRTEPVDKERFSIKKMEQYMSEILERFLTMEQYNPKRASVSAKQIAEDIKDSAKSLGFKRYKLISRVDIGSRQTQDIQVASKFLWNANTDNFASATYENDTMFAVATVFAVYMD